MTTTAVMRKQLFIGGEWRDAAGGKTIEVVNPATEEVIAEVASADRSGVSPNSQSRYAILCALGDSSGCNFVLVDLSGAGRRVLLLAIAYLSVAADHSADVLLSPALVQHARWNDCARCRPSHRAWRNLK